MSAAKRLLRPAAASLVNSTGGGAAGTGAKQGVGTPKVTRRRISEALTTTTPPHATPLRAAEATTVPLVKEMRELNGPPAWPIIGNFHAYIKKENQGRLHEVQVGKIKLFIYLFIYDYSILSFVMQKQVSIYLQLYYRRHGSL